MQDKSKPFGWVSVKGTIDDYSFKQFKLMPMGNEKLFFSVKSAIRETLEKAIMFILYSTPIIREL